METIIQRSNQNITPNTWILNIIRSLQINLDGHHMDITIRKDLALNEILPLKVAAGLFLQKLESYDLYGIKIAPHPDSAQRLQHPGWLSPDGPLQSGGVSRGPDHTILIDQ